MPLNPSQRKILEHSRDKLASLDTYNQGSRIIRSILENRNMDQKMIAALIDEIAPVLGTLVAPAREAHSWLDALLKDPVE